MLHLSFMISAQKNRKKTAITDLATDKSYTYDKLLIASLILKNKLSKYRSQYLGVMLPTTAGCHLTVIACLMSNKIPVMINYSMGAIDNCQQAIDKCGLTVIITSSKMLSKLKLKPIPEMIYIEDILKTVSIANKLQAVLISRLPNFLMRQFVHQGDREDVSVILFTSGSEQNPKAVQLTHRNIEHQIATLPDMAGATSEDIFAGALPLFHVFGLTITFWIPYLIGASIVTFANPLDYRFICENIRRYKVNFIVGTPTFFNGYLRRAKPGDFDSVRIGITGGDKLPEKIRLDFKNNHNVTVYEGYGATETSPVSSGNSRYNMRPGSIGKPVKGAQIKIVDTKTDRELPTGEIGKILVKGEMVMKGYLDDMEETCLHIRNGWYDTGDMGCFDEDGFLWHKGRLKRFVKVGGEMVSLVRVEESLLRLLPEDVQCCVVGLPDPVKGSEIVAAVSSEEINKLKIGIQLKLELPAIAIPRHFYHIPEMPIMGSGKINFREVKNICLQLREEWKANKTDLRQTINALLPKKHPQSEDNPDL
ncbi:MAG: AMP-binding protein [Candidatus Cloacimonetes bacterium]|nr:AMP-binding protein [Candidatus Cloacimonadota bacterium]